MSMTLNALKQTDDELNRMIAEGRFLEAIGRFYADDVAMVENDGQPTVGLAANLERERAFFGGAVEYWRGRLESQAVGDGVTFTEWTIELKFPGQPAVTARQVAARRWRDGKIVHERFYYRG
jgi:SnoaL-like protein